MNANVPSIWYHVVGVLLMIVAVLSLVVNILILVVFKKAFPTKRLRLINSNLVSLTASNIGIVLLFPLKLDACFHLGWRLGDEACQLNGFIDAVFAYSQIYIFTEIAVEKYQIIKTPVTVNPRREIVFLKIFLAWILAILLSCQPFLGFGSPYMMDHLQISCGMNYLDRSLNNVIYFFTCLMLGFIAPLVIISFCYIQIFKIVRRSNSNSSRQQSLSQQRIAIRRKLEFQLAKFAAISIIYFAISWTPYAVIAAMGTLGYEPSLLAEALSILFAKFSSTAYSFVYVFNHPKFSFSLLWGKCLKPQAIPKYQSGKTKPATLAIKLAGVKKPGRN